MGAIGRAIARGIIEQADADEFWRNKKRIERRKQIILEIHKLLDELKELE